MGYEIGQLHGWDERRAQDWFMTRYPAHDSLGAFLRNLNRLYRTHAALWECDYEADGFTWIDCNEEARRLYVFECRCATERIIRVLNLSDQVQIWDLDAPDSEPISDAQTQSDEVACKPVILIDTDAEPYGGATPVDRVCASLTDHRLHLTLAASSGIPILL